MEPLEELLTEKDLAEITARSVKTIQRERSQKRGCPFIKVGGSVRYQTAAIRAWLKGLEKSESEREKQP